MNIDHYTHLDTQERDVYRAFQAERWRLVVPLAAVCTGSYLVLVVLANFTSALDGEVAGPLTWAYVLAFAQFAVALAVASAYRRRMDRLEAAYFAPDATEPARAGGEEARS